MKDKEKNEVVEIDLIRLLTALWHRAWIVILSMLVAGIILFSYACFFITPMYQANVQMYVRNNTLSVGSTSVSLADLTASKSLVDTYIVILKSRKNLDSVIANGHFSMTYDQLNSRISASAVNETEVFRITVKDQDPKMAERIANQIADDLPNSIEAVMGDGVSVNVVDRADYTSVKASPNITRYTVVGLVLGFVISAAVIILRELFDEQIKDEEILKQEYDLPILAIIPSLDEEGKASHRHSYGYGGYYARSSRRRDGSDE